MSDNLFGYPEAVVYMIQYADEPIYKIGYTSHMNTRLRRIAVLMPYPVEVVWSIYTDDPQWAENYWHDHFRKKRRPGSGIVRSSEWFDLSDEDVALFKSHKVMRKPQQQPQDAQLTLPDNQKETLREAATKQVIKHYDSLVRQFPHHAVKLANSCDFQIRQLNIQVIRMQNSRFSAEEVIQRWEQNAYRAANKKV